MINCMFILKEGMSINIGKKKLPRLEEFLIYGWVSKYGK